MFAHNHIFLIPSSKSTSCLKFNNFTDFLLKKQSSNEKVLVDYRTGKTLNIDDNDKTIFEIRQYKFNKIMEYRKNNSDVILVNLSFLQDEKNLLQFLNILCDKYSIPKPKTFITNIKHTKSRLSEKNRLYNSQIGY